MSPVTYELDSVEVERDRTTVLRIQKMKIAGGRVTCVVGPNGSGKSTLLHLLAFLAKPARGAVSFEGRAVDFEHDLTEMRKHTTLVAQEPLMFHRSVRANLRYGLRQRGIRDDARIDGALERVGLSGFAARTATRLSGGERQRVAIARAIALGTKAILLDEPTASVDSRTRVGIEDVVRDLATGGSTVVLSTHDVEQARTIGDEIIVLERGAVVSSSERRAEHEVSSRKGFPENSE